MDDKQNTTQTAIIKTGVANLTRGLENVGGRLTLTATELSFTPHALNIQTQPVSIPLQSVTSTSLGFTFFLNIPVFPNALIVESQTGPYRFTVYGRKKWQLAINSALSNQSVQ